MKLVIRPMLAILITAALLLSGCSGFSVFGGSRASTVEWASNHGFTTSDIVGGQFQFFMLSRVTRAVKDETLTIYIEGDGAHWATPWHPPLDPTPSKPLVAALAAADPSPAVIYLGRPCQYLDATALSVCDAAWWVNRRFASQVVDAYDEVLTDLKSRNGAHRLRLIGHSGGGVIAALLALRRTDVEQLITIAAPLALSEWVSGHDMAPLDGSLDPARQSGNLPHAIHWVGGQDKTVPQAVVEAFIRKKGGHMWTVPTYGHECCWDQNWTELLKEVRP